MNSSKILRIGRLAAAAGLGIAAASIAVAAAEPSKGAGIEDEGAAPVTNLPYARGRSFRTLDEYLAFRRKSGAIDLPWYREVRPGLYKLETGNLRPPGPERYFTREELERKFGFER